MLAQIIHEAESLVAWRRLAGPVLPQLEPTPGRRYLTG